MKKILILITFQLITFADLNFYPIATAETLKTPQIKDQELKTYIFKFLDSVQQRTIGYSTAKKHLFGSLHLERNDDGSYFVRDVYCNKIYTKNTKEIGELGPELVPNHNIVNCEHTWPQSRFSRKFSANLQKGDLHHLYPTDSRANSTRSSYNFGEVSGGVDPSSNCSSSQYGNRTYEPPNEHKGNVARSMFYFSVRYQLKMDDEMERALKVWHDLDPVDSEEIKRNSDIYNIQLNRNPFIDFPNLVSAIDDF